MFFSKKKYSIREIGESPKFEEIIYCEGRLFGLSIDNEIYASVAVDNHRVWQKIAKPMHAIKALSRDPFGPIVIDGYGGVWRWRATKLNDPDPWEPMDWPEGIAEEQDS
jgi:hypothetical protein